MRFLDTDVDLILLALAVAPIVWSVQPATPDRAGAHSDAALVCHETSCEPAPLVWPDKTSESR